MYKYWISMFLAVFISSVSQMMLKKAANNQYKNIINEYLNIWVIGGYILMVISTICVIYAYKGIEYKNGAVIESLGYLLIMVLSYLFFNEKITKNKLIGNMIILLGIIIFYL
ncbi:MAG: EamA family transporter [Methanobrevibacter sp.]|nr:EamA family transporter [Methanobrevibacter sp.]